MRWRCRCSSRRRIASPPPRRRDGGGTRRQTTDVLLLTRPTLTPSTSSGQALPLKGMESRDDACVVPTGAGRLDPKAYLNARRVSARCKIEHYGNSARPPGLHVKLSAGEGASTRLNVFRSRLPPFHCCILHRPASLSILPRRFVQVFVTNDLQPNRKLARFVRM